LAKSRSHPAGKPQQKQQKAIPLLDLHGFLVEDVPDAVDRFLMQAQRKGAERVRIMPGKGSGKVRAAVTQYLKLGGFPFENEKLPGGTVNEGVLVVFLGD
jgi:dsDNA-specific endonuclease/ATPase MutS2